MAQFLFDPHGGIWRQVGLENPLPRWLLHSRARWLSCSLATVSLHVASHPPGPLHVAWSSHSGGLWVGRCTSYMVSGFQEAGSFLKPPGETRLFQEMAPHHFHPVLLIRAVTDKTQGSAVKGQQSSPDPQTLPLEGECPGHTAESM